MTKQARVAVVTGASAGIGKACADQLAASGWAVTGTSRRGTGGENTGWTGLVMDVDDDASVRDGIAGVVARAGRIDALVAAAGWGIAGAAECTPIADAKAQFETNFWGCVRVVQAVLPQMRAQGSGRIVLISSIAGGIGIPFQAYYCASKFALEGFGESIAYEVAPFGVQVTLVEPGNFATEFTARRRFARDGSGAQAYEEAMTRAVSAMEHDEATGPPPAKVAATVQRVLDSPHPPRRASVGRTMERVGLLAKRLVPYRAFEAAARQNLGGG